MTKVNGKNKGNTFERKIANLLSSRFSSYLGIDKAFRRNSDSGSFFGGSNMARVQQHDLDNACFGDIMCPKNFIYSVECKHYKTAPSFQSVISKEVTQWDTWIKQAEQDADNSKTLPLLIIKYNNVPEFVFIKNKLDLAEIMMYKGMYAYTLTSLLANEDASFFNNLAQNKTSIIEVL